MLNTVPKEVFEAAVVSHNTVGGIFDAILGRYKDQGLVDECTIVTNHADLRAHEHQTTAEFIDKYQASLARVEAVCDCACTSRHKMDVYHFLMAIQKAYPGYAREHRAEICRSNLPSINDMCNELTDETRRDDCVKSAHASTRQAQSGASKQTETRSRNNNQSHNNPAANSGNGQRSQNGQGRQGSNTSASDPKKAKAYCKHCDKTHISGGDNCWYSFPHLATSEWRDKNKSKIKEKSNRSTFASAVSDSDNGSIGFALTSVVTTTQPVVSDKVQKLMGRGYKDCLILDTGATDHICNDADRFTDFDQEPFHAVINTGAGPITVAQRSSIAVNVVRSDGSVHALSISDVLYAPGMFLSVISHSQLRRKALYYHSFDHKLYQRVDHVDHEVAFTPEIDGIPTLLLADSDLQHAQSLAIAAATTTKRASLLAPVRDVALKDLHEIFGHADTRVLEQLVKLTTGLRLTDTASFTCEPCMLSTSKQQVSRESPNRSARLLHRLHVDIVGPLTPLGAGGEKYWTLFTDDYSRY
jgi:hypothetical protein